MSPTDRRRDGDPLVSLVTVNFNGAHLLPDLLHSLERQTYRRHEILVVDNGSTDGSRELVRRDFPTVKLLEQTENRGFAGGNNAGIRAAQGELIALVNNDTAADPTWLEELVETLRADPEVAAAASKLVFFRPFVELSLAVQPGASGGPPRAWLAEDSAFEDCDYRKPVFKEGFGSPETVDRRRVRPIEGQATLYLPVPSLSAPDRVTCLRLVTSEHTSCPGGRLRVGLGADPLAVVDLGSDLDGDLDEELQGGRQKGFREHRIEVPSARLRASSFDLINNAGTRLSGTGVAADRGIYEPDRGQYDRAEDVDAFCGAAVLLRRSALDAVGLFDRDFFMYYEDTDLSWRLRSHGYRLRYQPRSRIRHLHATSSVEWSPLFTFHVIRNKLLMIAKNGGPRAFAVALAGELRSLAELLARLWHHRRSPRRILDGRELATRLRAYASLTVRLPRALMKRAGVLALRPTALWTAHR